jgi:hypothetical protein
MSMKVVFSSHRVENIPFLEREIEGARVVVLEEPENDLFLRVLRGDITPQRYVELIDTQFPVYTEKLMEMLRNVLQRHSEKKILQIEPYLKEVENLRYLNRGDEKVREMERKVNLAYIDYAESFLKGDFDDIVEKVITFAEADAERFLMRDKMRAEALIEARLDPPSIIEAGVMHTKLAEFLNAECVSIPELIASQIGVEYIDTPGNVLTKSFMYEFDCDKELLAAQSLVYVSIVEKKEMIPDSADPFPHFVHEQKVIRFVKRLSYGKCRQIFHRIWHSR